VAKKKCGHCGANNGPRSWTCSACGKGFTLRGIKKPDLDVTANPAGLSSAKPDNNARLWNLVEIYDGHDDKHARKRYGAEGETWQSKCGHYRISEQNTFMGVVMTDHYSRCVRLLFFQEGSWDIVRPKGRFKTPLAAIRRMVKHSDGQKVKATTHEERIQARADQILKRESVYGV